MTFLRVALSIFAILNVVFWALLAWTWAVKPAWTARLPLRLGTDERFRTTVPVWARLAAAIAGFWAVAAVLYLTVYAGNQASAVPRTASVPTAKSTRGEGMAAGSC